MFKILAKLNKLILPSFCKKDFDLSNASKFQLAIIAWRSYVTKKVINQ